MVAKILIVDDDEINADMFAKRILKRNFTVDRVNSGRMALAYLEHTRPDIILLDILMPDISGLDVLKEVRKKFSQIELSVIMLTASSEISDVVEALQLGANDFIQKPVNIEIAVARINTQFFAIRSHRDEIVKNELEALNAMIATYNHEINNPLTIAFGYLWKLKKDARPEYIQNVEEALKRVVDIVKKIENLATSKATREHYASKDRIYKLTDIKDDSTKKNNNR